MNARVAAVCVGLGLSTGSCGLPSRDNPNDPGARPAPQIAISVGGQATAIGGRNAGWVFDGRQSTSPGDTLAYFQWSVSAGPDLPSEETGWITVGNGPCSSGCEEARLDESDSVPLQLALHAIVEFEPFDLANPVPGTGSARRWMRLVLRDDGGRHGEAVVSFTVVNHAPTVTLGPSRRIAPGGRWWTKVFDRNGDGRVDSDDADPREVILVATTADVDPGDDALLVPAEWRAFGPLAARLDEDRDGRIDDVWFPDDPIRRRILRFPAPAWPQRNRVEVALGDVEGLLVARAELRVDVATSRWVYDEGGLQLRRLDTAAFFGAPAGNDNSGAWQPIAASETHLLASKGGEQGYFLLDPALRTVRDGVTLPGFDAVVSDGSGGWWMQSVGDGVLRHADRNLVVDLTAGDLDGDAINDFVACPAALAPAGKDAVWVLSGESCAAPPTSLIRYERSGSWTLFDALPDGAGGAFAAATLAGDGRGGVWIGGAGPGFGPRIRHLDSSGVETSVADLPAPSGTSSPLPLQQLAGDPETAWAIFGGRLLRRDGDGELRSTIPPCAGTLYADPSDGSASMPCLPQGGEVRFRPSTIDPDGLATSAGLFEGYWTIDSHMRGGPAALWGAAVTDFVGPPGEQYAVYEFFSIEGGHASPEVSVEVPYLDVTGAVTFVDDGVSFAVDGDTGFVWLWRPDCACIEIYSPEGEGVLSVPLTLTGDVPAATHGAIAIDERMREAWVAVSAPEGSDAPGALFRIPIPNDLSMPTPSRVEGLALDWVNGISVVPGGQVCVAGVLEGGTASGFAWRPEQSARVDAIPYVTLAQPAADPLHDECWFVTDYPASVFRIASTDTAGAAVAWASPLTLQLGTHAIAFDPAGGGMVSATVYGEVGNASGVFAVDWIEFEPYPGGRVSLDGDPFYGHLYLSVECGGGCAAISRIDRDRVERVRRDTALRFPRFR